MTSLSDSPRIDPDRPRTWAAGPQRSIHESTLVVVIALTLAGCCWLISADQGAEEGHRPWRAGSALRVLTTLMAMSFEYPTRRGAEIKWLIQGLGAAAALIVAATAWFVRRRSEEDNTGPAQPADAPAPEEPLQPCAPARLARSGWDLATIALLLFTTWMLLSALWAPWPQAALGEGVRQIICTVWAVALGRTLMRRGVRQAAVVLAAVLALTAMVGLWYWFERNPQQRLKFPIGNPIFLAACLLPGITVLAGLGVGALTQSLSPPANGRACRTATGWLWAAGGAVALAALLWALKLTDSRGPQLGLLVGLGVGACFWLTGRARRGLVAAIAVALLAGAFYVQVAGPPAFITRRSTTVAFRQYAWSYALSLLADRPVIGRGQAAYVLLAQQRAAEDAKNDPQVFASNLLGHAHNEWLEILADLGLVGFGLMATALGATFWCAALAVRHARGPGERGLAAGLAAALAALIVSEATDVGLRMPGLPVIFYTVIGLIWAQGRAVARLGPPVRSQARGLRWAGLAGALLAGLSIAAAAQEDWKGARAEQEVQNSIKNLRWNDALDQAARAGTHRLSVEALLSAGYYSNLAAYMAAEHRWQQMRDTIARLAPTSRVTAGARELVSEDAAAFDAYAGLCYESGRSLLDRIPRYPAIAGRIAEVFLLRQSLDAAEQQIGLRPDVRDLLPVARQWMRLEYERDPMDPYVTLRLFQLSQDEPVADRIRLLRPALRAGPRPMQPVPAGESLFGRGLGLDLFVDVEQALAALLQEPDYPAAMEQLLQEARSALDQPASAWPEPYQPETLRLAARERKLTRRFDEAAQLADLAARLSEQIVARFPAAVSFALIDRARYLLLAEPEQPEMALRVCRDAIDRWPASADRRLGLALRRSLAIYFLAAGQEQAARRQLAALAENLSPEQLDRLVGLGLGELCQSFWGAFPPQRQPSWFSDRLSRSLQLVPDWPVTLWLAANVALEQGDSAAGITHLEALDEAVDDPRQMAQGLNAIAERFPLDSEVQAYVRDCLATRPATAPQPAFPPTAGLPRLPFPAPGTLPSVPPSLASRPAGVPAAEPPLPSGLPGLLRPGGPAPTDQPAVEPRPETGSVFLPAGPGAGPASASAPAF